MSRAGGSNPLAPTIVYTPTNDPFGVTPTPLRVDRDSPGGAVVVAMPTLSGQEEPCTTIRTLSTLTLIIGCGDTSLTKYGTECGEGTEEIDGVCEPVIEDTGLLRSADDDDAGVDLELGFRART